MRIDRGWNRRGGEGESGVRVLMVAERLPPAIGGVERHIAGIVPHLRGAGLSLTLVAPAHDPTLPLEGSLGGAPTVRIPYTQGRTRYLRAWRWWARHRHLLDVDVLHFHGVYSLLHLSLPLLVLAPRAARYVTYHGYQMTVPVPLKDRVYHRVSERLVRGSIAIGEFLVPLFRLSPSVITYGACTVPEEPVPPPEEPRAVFVGRLAPDTGLDLILRGLGVLAREGITLPLAVCGDGPWRQKLEVLAQEVGVEATFHGFVEDPTPFIAASTIVFATGYLAMLEAMAWRRPLVTAYHTWVKESYLRSMQGARSLYLVAGSPEEVAAHVRVVLREGVSPARREEAFRFAAAHTWDALAGHYLRVWGAR